jgi:GIY-YIG catalytic domain
MPWAGYAPEGALTVLRRCAVCEQGRYVRLNHLKADDPDLCAQCLGATPRSRTVQIYAITHGPSGRHYVGAAANPSTRWAEHLSSLRLGRHHNVLLQEAADRDGLASFRFRVVERVPYPKHRYEREAWWILALGARHPFYGFNVGVPYRKPAG